MHEPDQHEAKRKAAPPGLARREFLMVASAAGATAWLGTPAFGASPYPHDTLDAALAAARFDPTHTGNFLAVFTADTHYGHGTPENILPPIIHEVNAIKPRPAFFCVDGDMICSASLSFGQVPNERQKEKAIAEFKLFKRDLALLSPEIPVKLVLGNHDTHPKEKDDTPELFHAVFPDRPPYYSFDVERVHFSCLNGGSSGCIAPEQRQWFRDDVQNHVGPGKTLVIVCHQPSLGSVTAERGITRAIHEALGNAKGELWFIGGHVHANGLKEFRLPGGNDIEQLSITTGSPEIWGDKNHPGYWILGFSGGRLAVRIFRKLGANAGYAVGPMPAKKNARPLTLPFAGRNDIPWKVMVGEGDKRFLIDAKAAWCLNYWHYNRHLIYRFPLSLAGGKAGRFAVLQSPCYREAPRFFTSPDGENWQEAEDVRHEGNSFTSFVIPPECLRAKVIFVRLEKCVVSGFALTK